MEEIWLNKGRGESEAKRKLESKVRVGGDKWARGKIRVCGERRERVAMQTDIKGSRLVCTFIVLLLIG